MLKRIKDSIFDILRQADWLLLCLCCGAALFGLVMIASATNFLNSWKMVIVQACAIVLGVGIYFLMSQIDLTEAAKRWKWLLGFGIVMFLLLKTPLGIENNGNRAWLGIEGFPANIQPAEIVKLTFILVLSRQLVMGQGELGAEIPAFHCVSGGARAADGGALLRHLLGHGQRPGVYLHLRGHGLCGRGGGPVVHHRPAGRRRRRFTWLWELDRIPGLYEGAVHGGDSDHNLDPLGAGWQQTRSLLALGGGKLTGQGLFHGIQTQANTPAVCPFRLHGLHLLRHRRGAGDAGVPGGRAAAGGHHRAVPDGRARKARNTTESYVCVGVAAVLIFQTISNVGMCLFVLPVIGLTLPFFSYGGSSIVTLFAAMGMVTQRPDATPCRIGCGKGGGHGA